MTTFLDDDTEGWFDEVRSYSISHLITPSGRLFCIYTLNRGVGPEDPPLIFDLPMDYEKIYYQPWWEWGTHNWFEWTSDPPFMTNSFPQLAVKNSSPMTLAITRRPFSESITSG